MGRKRKKFSAGPSAGKKKNRYHHVFDKRLFQQILAEMYLAGKPLSINDICKALNLPRSGRQLIGDLLATLSHQGKVVKKGKQHFSLAGNSNIVEATLEMNPAGFGFATNISKRSRLGLSEKDPFISASRLGSAVHGDTVLVDIIRTRRDGRSDAEIIKVLERKRKTISGYYQADQRFGIVIPDDSRFPGRILLSEPADQTINNGDAVIVRLGNDARDNYTWRGEILEILGNPSDIQVQYRLVAEKFDLPLRFSEQAETDARQSGRDPAKDHRLDLRQINHVTIDGEDAKDFDDAVAVETLQDGYRLYVSIADVAAYVKTGSRLDLEAYERGTSVYFPGTVIPMLPEHLSNNLCSLLPDQDRLTVSAIIDFDRNGRQQARKFCRTVIRSKRRFTYDTVTRILVEKDPDVRRQCQELLAPLTWAAELATLLKSRRDDRGAIGFTIPEADIQIGADGRITSIRKAPRTFAHQIIEEFMLAANEAVAQEFDRRGKELLYRIHEKPDPDKITDFISFSSTLGLETRSDGTSPAWYNKILNQVRDTPHEYIVNNLLLRTMQQARYSDENEGHFGLSTDLYTHFTSPIRRYPDLIVHRLLCAMIGADGPKSGIGKETKASPAPSLKQAGIHLSACERTAISSERDMADRLKCLFMETRVGETFKAVISGVSDTAFFVELLDIFISGAVFLSTLTDDYYLLDVKRHRLIGDVSGKVLQMGNLVEVILNDVDRSQNRMSFTLKQTL